MISMVQDTSMVGDIQGALNLIGMLSPEEVEAHTDEIIRVHQLKGSLVATIQHQSDGLEPTMVYNVTSDDTLGERRLRPSRWDQVMEGAVTGLGGM